MAAFVLALFTAFAYAELVSKYPRAAGAALYTLRAFRTPFFTFMVAFAVMSSGIASASTLARAFAGDYLSEFVDLPLVLAAIAMILIVAAINMRRAPSRARSSPGSRSQGPSTCSSHSPPRLSCRPTSCRGPTRRCSRSSRKARWASRRGCSPSSR
jgi:hypothetical protein